MLLFLHGVDGSGDFVMWCLEDMGLILLFLLDGLMCYVSYMDRHYLLIIVFHTSCFLRNWVLLLHDIFM
ncbi:hypothetical protein J3F84DRAFT_370814 [Trichoderma pleuroticola]